MKKASEKIVGVISWIFTVISILIMIFTILSSTVLNRNDKNLFGYKAFVVMSDSMSATDFNAGDIVIAKSVDPTTLSAGDIITFQSENEESYGETVTHKIRRLTVDAEGNPGFITYGTTTDTDDETVVTYAFVLGKYLFSIPKLGTFFFFLKTTPGYFICIFVPFMILIVIQAVKSMNLFRKYKKEQKAQLEQERKQLAQEREKNEQMMQKLLEIQAQLTGQSASMNTVSFAEDIIESKGSENPAKSETDNPDS